ncbi:hypothetical protein chiPu_0004398 [Chiloscyllium punctatum]|uniref:Uncharacterized protein n=1 Tax=Chiloscyllium punctatum TaxID=137246 RepID=A0A401S6G1_CHIPU|nr:hypothetical protein [Chiloscyllium punctatum]
MLIMLPPHVLRDSCLAEFHKFFYQSSRSEKQGRVKCMNVAIHLDTESGLKHNMDCLKQHPSASPAVAAERDPFEAIMKNTVVQFSELLCFLTEMLQCEQEAEEDDNDDKRIALGLAKEY